MTTPDRHNTHGRDSRDGRGRYTRTRDNAQRDAEACRLRTHGATYQQIADQLGFRHRDGAYRAVQRALHATVAEPAGELRQLELARLEELWRRAWQVLARDHYVTQLGHLVQGPDGGPLVDDAPKLAAIDRLLKVQQRRAALLGLDAPTKVQAITVDTVEAEIERLSRQLGITGDSGGGQQQQRRRREIEP